MKTILFFNNKGGVGKTTLVYHFTHMLAVLGYKALAVDLDPQANLTSMFLSDEKLEEVFAFEGQRQTILQALRPILTGEGDIAQATMHKITDSIFLIAGDLELSAFEDELSENWGKCLDKKEPAFRVTSAFYRIMKSAAEKIEADYVVVDVGPNFGALNRAVLICADAVVIPMAADLFSLQGLKNLGQQLNKWREEWRERISKNPNPNLALPAGTMHPIGYVVMQHSNMGSRPVKSYQRWVDRIPETYRKYILNHQHSLFDASQDIQLAMLKHYRSLAPLAMEAHKPMFHLKPADGAIGAHVYAAKSVGDDFEKLAKRIIECTAQIGQQKASIK